jgi:hypothetical protein
MKQRELVYGECSEGLIFVDRDLAQELAALRRGFATWGEARGALSPRRWAEIVEVFAGADEREPADEDTYDLERVPGFADGDWPEWPARLMLKWMPKDVVEKFGRVDDSVLNGQFFSIDPKNEADVVFALEAEGWSCVKDELLTLAASGY